MKKLAYLLVAISMIGCLLGGCATNSGNTMNDTREHAGSERDVSESYDNALA